jgi:hypothetical protein
MDINLRGFENKLISENYLKYIYPRELFEYYLSISEHLKLLEYNKFKKIIQDIFIIKDYQK